MRGLLELLLSPVDLVLVEGFKFYPHAKLEVYRAEIGKPLLARNDPHIIGIATDKPLPDIKLPQMALDDTSAIADFIIRHCAVAEIDA